MNDSNEMNFTKIYNLIDDHKIMRYEYFYYRQMLQICYRSDNALGFRMNNRYDFFGTFGL